MLHARTPAEAGLDLSVPQDAEWALDLWLTETERQTAIRSLMAAGWRPVENMLFGSGLMGPDGEVILS